MKRWNIKKGKSVENAKIDAFLEEVIAVSKKHGFSIGHEDDQGAFRIEKFCPDNVAWLHNAQDAT